MNEIERLYAFLKKRNGHSDNKLCLVNAQQIGGGKQNYCLTTAEDNSQSMGYGLVSGWLALPSKIQGNDWQKQFTQHWWNFDLNLQKHLDFLQILKMEHYTYKMMKLQTSFLKIVID